MEAYLSVIQEFKYLEPIKFTIKITIRNRGMMLHENLEYKNLTVF